MRSSAEYVRFVLVEMKFGDRCGVSGGMCEAVRQESNTDKG